MRKGFTLIELLVVIVIIGILATLATVGLNSVRAKARDSKRISDIRQMQSALELYMNDNNSYPTNGGFTIGAPLTSPNGATTYMSKIPSNPKPWAEGACTSGGAEYAYSYINANSYQLSYCLANKVNDLPAGQAVAMSGSINNACTPSCSGKYCGDSNGCGSTCDIANFKQNADTCSSGVAKCGALAACTGTSDTCTGSVCKCGSLAACATGKTCVEGSCVTTCDGAVFTGGGITNGTITDTRATETTIYNTVFIDLDGDSVQETTDQCWMRENLRTATQTGGTALVKDTDYRCAGNTSNAEDCPSSPDTGTTSRMGYFYNWATALNLPGSCYGSDCSGSIAAKHRGICPAGWHVPSDSDWTALVNRAQDLAVPTSGSACGSGASCSSAGKVLREAGMTNWDSNSSPVADNSTGFTWRGAGAYVGSYSGAKSIAFMITSNQASIGNQYRRYISSGSNPVARDTYGANSIYMFNLRCIKD